VSPNEGYQVVLGKDEFARWQLWRARRDLFQPGARHAAAKDGEKPFVDRQLLRAVECVEKAADQGSDRRSRTG
jgi:hypothetical protein